MKRNFKKCTICNTFHWTNEICPPIFYFKHEEWGDEFQEIRAHTFACAAEVFAELYNESNGHALMNDDIDVIISDGKIEKKYNVSAEPDIYYSVIEIND